MSKIPLGPRILGIPLKLNNYKIITFLITFTTYVTYHASRKPLSIVKNGLHANCTEYAIHNSIPIPIANETFCWFPPFDTMDYSSKFSELDLAFLASYALAMFLSGHLAERINMRIYLAIGCFSCSIATCLFGSGYFFSIHSFIFYIFCQLLNGAVQATGWPAVVALMANWFGKSKRGLMMGIWNANSSIGNILGSLLAGIFVLDRWGWSFVLPGILIGVAGLFCLLFIVPHPEDCGLPNQNVSEQVTPSMHEESLNQPEEIEIVKDEAISFFGAIKQPGVLEYSLCLFFIKFVSYSFLFCLPRYLNSEVKFDAGLSAKVSTVFDLGGITGGVIFGLITDRIGAYAIVLLPTLIFSGPMILAYFAFGSNQVFWNSLFLFFLGVIINGPYGLITTTVSADLGTNEKLAKNSKALATITAIIDGTGSLGAAIGPVLVDYLEGVGWKYSFLILSISIAFSGLLLARRFYFDIMTIQRRKAQDDTDQLIQD